MGLSAPSQAAFFLAVMLAVLALLVRYADVAIPIVHGHSFETLLAAFLLLLAGHFPGILRPFGRPFIALTIARMSGPESR
jgi:hypothetical protein